MITEPAKLLRIYINEQDRHAGKPLYEAIVDRCREMDVAGVTVLRALEGYEETAEIHRSHLFAGDLPITITIVERPEKAQEILPVLEEMVNSGRIAVTDVEVVAISNGDTTALG
jgi:PII-like signaling protein